MADPLTSNMPKVSTLCIAAIEGLADNLIALAAAATSDISNFAMSADVTGFSSDLGNYDMCERQVRRRGRACSTHSVYAAGVPCAQCVWLSYLTLSLSLSFSSSSHTPVPPVPLPRCP
jgi:hypothetical protein